MKAYTLAMLQELAGSDGHRIVEKEIVEWVNKKVCAKRKRIPLFFFAFFFCCVVLLYKYL